MRGFILVLMLIHFAQDAYSDEVSKNTLERYYSKDIEELLNVETQSKATIGSRGGSRDALEANVPIDIITSEQLMNTGHQELSRALTKLVVGFNAPNPSITDGTDHSRPFTLRGLSADQVLVLINGKRLHHSSLLHMNGTIGGGTSSVDLDTIPIMAIERVEILRDGAAAQYGSDAIAGIINIILKGYGQENVVQTGYGKTIHGDGEYKHISLFYTQALKEDGFIALTFEGSDQEQTNRAGYRSGVIRDHFGDPDANNIRFSLNAEAPKADVVWYLNGIANQRKSSAGAFYRSATDSRNIPALYPEGFLPLIEPEIHDTSWSGGIRGITDSEIKWDASYTFGLSDFHFFVNNSLNRSLGVSTPTSFDSGSTRLIEQIVNLDVSKKYDKLLLASGLEFRKQNYSIHKGDSASYILGTDTLYWAGAQGFPGFSLDNEVDVNRHNVAAYIDTSYAAFEWLRLNAAVRAEQYSDFGSTLNGKLSFKLYPKDDFMFRGSVSTGFRAPSITQSHFNYTQTTNSGGNIIEFGNYGVDDPIARALGATDLKPETSLHYNTGIVWQPAPDFSLSVDFFRVNIEDKITQTTWIEKGYFGTAVDAILNQNGVDGARYFTNALSTKTDGIDIRMDYKYLLENSNRLKMAAAYQRNSTHITGVSNKINNLGIPVSDWVTQQDVFVTIEHGQPKDKVMLWSKYESSLFDLALTLNRFGSFQSYSGSAGIITFDPKWTVDTQIDFHLTKKVTLSFGVENLFDTMPDKWGDVKNNLTGTGKIVEYSQYAPFGYNGAFYYSKIRMKF